MITDTYKKAMKIGHILIRIINKDEDIIPDEWSDCTELAHIIDYVKCDVTEEAIRDAIEAIKDEQESPKHKVFTDLGWRDEVRGLVAGYYFGEPDPYTLLLAGKVEAEWDSDIHGNYGYYHDVCKKIMDEA